MMLDAGVRERPGRVSDEARPVFDTLAGKLRIPSTRPGQASRVVLLLLAAAGLGLIVAGVVRGAVRAIARARRSST